MRSSARHRMRTSAHPSHEALSYLSLACWSPDAWLPKYFILARAARLSLYRLRVVHALAHSRRCSLHTAGMRRVRLVHSPLRARMLPCLQSIRQKRPPLPILRRPTSRSSPAQSSALSSTASASSATICSALRQIGLMPSSAPTATKANTGAGFRFQFSLFHFPAACAATFPRPSRSRLTMPFTLSKQHPARGYP